MKPILIDKEKCIGCGACVKDCVAGYLRLYQGMAVTGDAGCISCGHCYAVCPVDAVTVTGVEPDGGEMASMAEFDSDRLLQAMKSRRTVRQFRDQPVEEEKIAKIIEAGRYCPTGTNSQDVAYTVLGSRQAEIEEICVSLARKGIGAAGKFAKTLQDMRIDDHFFFKGAPLVIVVSGKSAGNANLASSYMELMAESMGLGVLYSGFFVACTMLSGRIRRILELPKGHKAVTCLVIGYPNVTYRRIPGRKPAQIKKL